MGTKDNSILEISEKSGTIQVVVAGHGEGEVWGLDQHPAAPKYITASYDGTVRLWDIPSKVYCAASLYLCHVVIFWVIRSLLPLLACSPENGMQCVIVLQ